MRNWIDSVPERKPHDAPLQPIAILEKKNHLLKLKFYVFSAFTSDKKSFTDHSQGRITRSLTTEDKKETKENCQSTNSQVGDPDPGIISPNDI